MPLLHLPTPSLLPSPLKPLLSSSKPLRWTPPRRRPPPRPSAYAGNGDLDVFTKYSGYLFEGGRSEADLLEAYDIGAIAEIYRRKPIMLVRRFVQIGTSFGRWFAVRYVDGLLGRSDAMFKMAHLDITMATSSY